MHKFFLDFNNHIVFPQVKKIVRGRNTETINCYENILVVSEGKRTAEQMTRRQMNGNLWQSFNRQDNTLAHLHVGEDVEHTEGS